MVHSLLKELAEQSLFYRKIKWRKVRAPLGRVPGNAWEAWAYGKCHRKYTACLQVRVKWCGKSAPRVWQQTWQGKPHSEQDQIGEQTRGPRGSWVDCLSW